MAPFLVTKIDPVSKSDIEQCCMCTVRTNGVSVNPSRPLSPLILKQLTSYVIALNICSLIGHGLIHGCKLSFNSNIVKRAVKRLMCEERSARWSEMAGETIILYLFPIRLAADYGWSGSCSVLLRKLLIMLKLYSSNFRSGFQISNVCRSFSVIEFCTPS